MEAVGNAAHELIEEIRRQFRGDPRSHGRKKPGLKLSAREISALQRALREMLVPGLTAVVVPLLVGFLPFLGKKKPWEGFFMRRFSRRGSMAIFMANTGGYWDNAQKYIESGLLWER